LRFVKFRFGVDVDVDVEEDASETRLIGNKL